MQFTPDLLVAIGNGLLVVGIPLGIVGIVSAMVAYRILGKVVDPDAAMEWMVRWEEMRTLERWTLLQAYTRMDQRGRAAFRDIYFQLGCQVFKEFGFFQSWVLALRGDAWLRKELLVAHRRPPTLFRPLVLAWPMDHPDRPITVPQLWCSEFWGGAVSFGLLLTLFGIAVRFIRV